MATLTKNHQSFKIETMFNRIRYSWTFKDLGLAQLAKETVELRIKQIKKGLISSPPAEEMRAFLFSETQTQPVYSPPKPTTVAIKEPPLVDVIDEWIELRKDQVSASTHYTNSRHVELIESFLKKCRAKKSTTASEFDAYGYAEWRRKSVADATVKKELMTYSTMCKDMEVESCEVPFIQKRATEPLSYSLETATDGRKVILTDRETRELLQIMRDRTSEMIADAVEFVAYIPIRRGELTRITSDLFSGDLAHVTLPNPKGNAIRRRSGKRSLTRRSDASVSYRRLPVPAQIKGMLRRRIESKASGENLFTDKKNTLSSAFQKAKRNTKFDKPGLAWHCLRHTAASRMLGAGVNIAVIAKILGHSDPMTTLRMYSHAYDSDVADAMNLL